MRARLAGTASAAVCLFGACLVLAQSGEPLQQPAARPVAPKTPVARVVTLAPSLTELVYAAGAGDKLAGVSAYSDYPLAARRLPEVADAAGISWESLMALKPDLVLAWKGGTRPADISRLNALGINVLVIEIRRLADVARALRTIGKAVSRPQPAESMAALFRRQLDTLRESNAGKPVVRTFFEISSNPLMTINRDHFISEMIGLCGGANIFDDLPGLVGEPSREELVARGPEAILYGKSPGQTQLANVPAYAGLSAVGAGRVYGITADYAFRPGPRMLLAAREICDALDLSRAALAGTRPH